MPGKEEEKVDKKKKKTHGKYGERRIKYESTTCDSHIKGTRNPQ